MHANFMKLPEACYALQWSVALICVGQFVDWHGRNIKDRLLTLYYDMRCPHQVRNVSITLVRSMFEKHILMFERDKSLLQRARCTKGGDAWLV